MIKNIQFYHESSERARNRNDENAHENETVDTTVWTNVDGETTEGPLPDPEEETEHLNDLISEADIERLLDHPYSPRERLFADAAIAIGVNAGVLRDDEYTGPYPLPAISATERHLAQFKAWDEMLKNPEEERSGPTLDSTSVLPPPNQTFERDDEPVSFAFFSGPPPATTPGPTLNARQTMAHAIVTSHLHAHLSQQNPPQRLVIVHGQGGTGKSTLLNAISKTFDEMGASALLAKTAMSGVAASIVGGQTLHSWAALPIVPPTSKKWVTHPSREVKTRRQNNMENVLWLTIDEMSMLTSPWLLYLSQATGMVRTGIAAEDASIPFGGLSVVLLGDFHQLPPVAKGKTELYHPCNGH